MVDYERKVSWLDYSFQPIKRQIKVIFVSVVESYYDGYMDAVAAIIICFPCGEKGNGDDVGGSINYD